MTEYTTPTTKDSYSKNALEYDFGIPALRVEKRDFVATFKANAEIWSRFKQECAFRGVSICHVLEALMEAWLEGQKATATVVKPVVVNLTMQHVVQRPRRMAYYPDVPGPVCSLRGCGCENAAVVRLKKGEGARSMYAFACAEHIQYFERKHFVSVGTYDR